MRMVRISKGRHYFCKSVEIKRILQERNDIPMRTTYYYRHLFLVLAVAFWTLSVSAQGPGRQWQAPADPAYEMREISCFLSAFKYSDIMQKIVKGCKGKDIF